MFSDSMLCAATSFTPSFKNFSSLFSGGADGLMIDLTDTTTLFQDPNGSLTVSANTNPIGLALDQHKWGGKTLAQMRNDQPEIVPNGKFDSDITGWTQFIGTISWDSVNQRLALNTTGGGGQARSGALTTVVGRWYELSVDYVSSNGAVGIVRIGTAAGGSQIHSATNLASGATHRRWFQATTTTTFISLEDGTSATRTLYWDNVSLKEIDGHHATQTGSNRPTWASATTDVTFNGTSQYLITDYSAGSGQNFLAARFRSNSVTSEKVLIGAMLAGPPYARLALRSGSQLGLAYWGTDSSLFGTTVLSSKSDATLFSDRGASNTEIAYNGVVEATVANAGTPSSKALYIGADNSTTVTNYYDSGIKRIVAVQARAQATMSAANIHTNLITN